MYEPQQPGLNLAQKLSHYVQPISYCLHARSPSCRHPTPSPTFFTLFQYIPCWLHLVQEVCKRSVQPIADLPHVHRPLHDDGGQVGPCAVRRQDRPAGLQDTLTLCVTLVKCGCLFAQV